MGGMAERHPQTRHALGCSSLLSCTVQHDFGLAVTVADYLNLGHPHPAKTEPKSFENRLFGCEPCPKARNRIARLPGGLALQRGEQPLRHQGTALQHCAEPV